MPLDEPAQVLRDPDERFILDGVDYVAVATDHKRKGMCHTCAFYPSEQSKNCHDHRCHGPDLIFLRLVDAATFKLTGKLDDHR